MARKVFISVLGTGYYNRTKYYWGGKENFVETRFVQEASLRLLTKDWDKDDYVYFFLTEAAKKTNWKSPAQLNDRRVKDGERDPYKGLDERIKEINTPYKYKPIDIPDGNEIWKIFDIIYNVLEKDDNIYIDITHSFRYLPMLLLVLLNYAKYLKNIKIKQITYGNYEARDANGFAPIVNLTAFSELQDWTIAANDFVNFGQVAKIYELTKITVNPILKNSGKEKEAAYLLKGINKHLSNFALDIQTCRGKNIIENNSVDKTNQIFKDIENEIIKPLNPILDKIKDRIKGFKTNNVLNGVAAVEWCLNNGLIQQGITILQETAISYFCEEVKVDLHDRKTREVISSYLGYVARKKDKEKYNEKDKEDIIKKMKDTTLIQSLKEWYGQLSFERNDINHNGMLSNSKSSGEKFQINLEKRLKEFKEIINYVN